MLLMHHILQKGELEVDRILARIEHGEGDVDRCAGLHEQEAIVHVLQIFLWGEATAGHDVAAQVIQGNLNDRVRLIERRLIGEGGTDQQGIGLRGMAAHIAA
jgi:hypothetical protein